MILFISENNNLTDNGGESKKNNPAERGLIIYLCAAAFCFMFFIVYDCFSHGIHSDFMTFLFLIPLVLGALPCLFFVLAKKIRFPGRLSVNLWNSGVAAVTCASVLEGIFEIAGAESVYQIYLFYFGLGMLFGGAVAFVIGKIREKHNAVH